EDRHDLHARGQPVGVQLIDRLLDDLEHFAGIFPTAHDHNAFRAIAVFASFVVDTKDAGLRRCAELHAPDIARKDGYAIRRIEHDVFDIGHRLNQAYAAHH